MVAPKRANRVATTPTVGKEKAANPLVLRKDKSKYVNGNAAYNKMTFKSE